MLDAGKAAALTMNLDLSTEAGSQVNETWESKFYLKQIGSKAPPPMSFALKSSMVRSLIFERIE